MNTRVLSLEQGEHMQKQLAIYNAATAYGTRSIPELSIVEEAARELIAMGCKITIAGWDSWCPKMISY